MKLSLRELSAGYGGRPVLSGVNISFREGEITAFIGPNGAGKSTILRTLSGMLPPVSGEVLLGDKSLSSLTRMELARQIALVLTERPVLRMMTGYELVSQGRYPYTGLLGVLESKDRRAVEEALKRTGAAYLADRQISAMSDGERQKLLLSRAICQEPEILVLDEPFLFLDIGRQLEFYSILKEFAEGGRTVLLSIHELGMASRLPDRLIAVGEGGIVADGTPGEVLEPERIRSLYHIRDEDYDKYMSRSEGQWFIT